MNLFFESLSPSTVRQSADAVALEAAVQGRAGQVRDPRLERIKAVLERQKRVAPKGDDDGFVLG